MGKNYTPEKKFTDFENTSSTNMRIINNENIQNNNQLNSPVKAAINPYMDKSIENIANKNANDSIEQKMRFAQSRTDSTLFGEATAGLLNVTYHGRSCAKAFCRVSPWLQFYDT